MKSKITKEQLAAEHAKAVAEQPDYVSFVAGLDLLTDTEIDELRATGMDRTMRGLLNRETVRRQNAAPVLEASPGPAQFSRGRGR